MNAAAARARLADNTFRSLRVRNFRLWFIGQTISIAGTFTQMVAQAWLVLDLSHNSSVAVGTVTALQFAPTLAFGLWGGLLADRLDKRKLLIGTQAAMAVVASVLAVLTITGLVQLWMVYVASFLTGMATFADTPARQSFTSELVREDDLGNAVGLNSATFNAARVVGPSVAGVVLVIGGPGACFAVNATSYLAVIVALVLMRPAELHRQPPVAKAKGQLRDGLRYAWGHSVLRAHLLLAIAMGSFGLSFQVIMPVLAKLTFHGGASTFTMLMVLQGFGALAGCLVLASRPATGTTVVVSGIAFGLCQVLAGLAPSLGFALVLMPVLGYAMITALSCSNAIVQMIAAPSFRGRVIGTRSLIILGGTPIGSMISGYISDHLGPRWALAMAGSIVALVNLACAKGLRSEHRPALVEDEHDDDILVVAVA
ncbi:MAG: MFS transporter [Acidobacteria bacterium]|nr:MFS transporter [Acidobacteriota bacterium]